MENKKIKTTLQLAETIGLLQKLVELENDLHAYLNGANSGNYLVKIELGSFVDQISETIEILTVEVHNSETCNALEGFD